MTRTRLLAVVADDFGIGPATSRGILRLARAGVVTATVLLVNSPHAEGAARDWRQSPPDADLGWHPCLTLDRPVLPPARVRTLVNSEGKFHRLGDLIARLFTGRISPTEVRAELAAQLDRFRDLTATRPAVVNAHHHVHVFPPVGAALRDVLKTSGTRPYLRRVCESWRTMRRVAGGRFKRLMLRTFGGRAARRQVAEGFPGNDWLAGVTDPPAVHSPWFFDRWLRAVPGRRVELTCHPGEPDDALLGRDAEPGDGLYERRPRELALLAAPAFREAVTDAGFRLVRPSEMGIEGTKPWRIAG
jgi:predicted glycoside hydrolase/deacetylase ChbG (UPF0249 family)